MSIDNSSPGFNGKLYWFTAVVENVNDPRKMGRLRCRIIGKDTDRLDQQPSEDLPWAMPLHPLTGVHQSLDIKPSDFVFGFWMDDKSCQVPVIVGAYPGIKRTEENITRGFSTQLTDDEKKMVPVAPPGVKTAGRDVDTVTGSPLSTRGVLAGTLIAKTNAEVVHVCDISLKLKQSVIFEDLKQSQLVAQARAKIEAFISSLGYSPDSLSQRAIEIVRDIKRELQKLKIEIAKIKSYAETAKLVLDTLHSIVNWIESLPERLKNELSNCLSAFTDGIKSALKDSLTLSTTGSSLDDLTGDLDADVSELEDDLGIEEVQIPEALSAALLPANTDENIQLISDAVDSFVNDQLENNENITNVYDQDDRRFDV